MAYLLAIDQGTTNSRAIIFNSEGKLISQYQLDLKQYYPEEGWVEQDPEEMWINTLKCCKEAISISQLSVKEIVAAGITNQRETTIIWDKKSGNTLYPAIVWQDRRTADFCKEWVDNKKQTTLQQKTGLLMDPYFSASKIVWLLNTLPDARKRAERGELAFGTVDSFLLWRLTKGKMHATDATNASRTLLFNIHTQEWDQELLKAFDIPESILPIVLDSAADFGNIDASYLGIEIPIASMIGDQQAATVGQACFEEGMIKSTYGTGCFMLLNTGSRPIHSKNKLLTTVAYRLNKKVTYGLEGSIFSAGATIKWLKDQLNIITTSAESEQLASMVKDTGGVYCIPAFTGLGAPYWDASAKGAFLGLTFNTKKEHMVRASLEAVAYQTNDLLTAMKEDGQEKFTSLRVDGGMATNNWLLQYLADILNLEIKKPMCVETTALGAAYLAGLQKGVFQSLDEIASLWTAEKKFSPNMSKELRDQNCQNWHDAITKILIKM